MKEVSEKLKASFKARKKRVKAKVSVSPSLAHFSTASGNATLYFPDSGVKIFLANAVFAKISSGIDYRGASKTHTVELVCTDIKMLREKDIEVLPKPGRSKPKSRLKKKKGPDFIKELEELGKG